MSSPSYLPHAMYPTTTILETASQTITGAWLNTVPSNVGIASKQIWVSSQCEGYETDSYQSVCQKPCHFYVLTYSLKCIVTIVICFLPSCVVLLLPTALRRKMSYKASVSYATSGCFLPFIFSVPARLLCKAMLFCMNCVMKDCTLLR